MAKARNRKAAPRTKSLARRSRGAARVKGGSTSAQVTPVATAQVVPMGARAQVVPIRPQRPSF
jgi:hypothetical protein